MRDELTAANAGQSPDQARISALLDQMLDAQRQRLDLVRQEQNDLARFMTPLQRAGYLALQDQLRRRIEEMRRTRQMPRGAPPR